MANAPKRIWAKVHGASTYILTGQRELLGGWNERARNGQAEYISADLVPQWQPIETAPRDGTIMDVWIPGQGRECDVWHKDCWSLHGTPSHWMPLPAPPEGGA